MQVRHAPCSSTYGMSVREAPCRLTTVRWQVDAGHARRCMQLADDHGASTHHVSLRSAARLEEAAEVAAVGVLLAAARRDGALRLCAPVRKPSQQRRSTLVCCAKQVCAMQVRQFAGPGDVTAPPFKPRTSVLAVSDARTPTLRVHEGAGGLVLLAVAAGHDAALGGAGRQRRQRHGGGGEGRHCLLGDVGHGVLRDRHGA